MDEEPFDECEECGKELTDAGEGDLGICWDCWEMLDND